MLRGEFGFINEMAKMENMQAFEERMTMLREKLQRDRESRNAFWGLAGSVGGWLAGGPVGGAIGGWIGGLGGGGGGGGAAALATSNPGGIFGMGPYGYGR
jgi:hypothetical protein